MLNIKLSSWAGTCQEINSFFKLIYEIYAKEIKKEHPRNICIYNFWLENITIINELKSLGIKLVYDLEDIQKEDIVILPFTGVNQNELEYLENNKIEYYDTRCAKQKNNTFDFCKNNCDHMKKIVLEAKKESLKYDYVFIVDNCSELLKAVKPKKNKYIFTDILKFSQFILKSNINIKDKIYITGGINTTKKELNNYYNLCYFLIFYKYLLNKYTRAQDKQNAKLTQEDEHQLIQKVINDITRLNQGGKYIRATLIALGYFMAENKIKDNNEYLDLAFAYELFQTSVLIHDDIIDNTKMRRGKETIPRRICREYIANKKKKEYKNDVVCLANSLGICAGDLGFYEANKMIIDSYQKHKNFAKIMAIYNDIIIKTIKGEILDVYLPFIGKYNYGRAEEKDILDIYKLKTSWYTIIGPFSLGYALGGKNISSSLTFIMNKIGIAFQIKDDILGIFSDSEVIGKPNTSDIEEFKQTILYSYIINTNYKDKFLKIYGRKNINEKKLNLIREYLLKSGAYNYAQDYLNKLMLEVDTEIDNLKITNEFKSILKGLIIFINIREK